MLWNSKKMIKIIEPWQRKVRCLLQDKCCHFISLKNNVCLIHKSTWQQGGTHTSCTLRVQSCKPGHHQGSTELMNDRIKTKSWQVAKMYLSLNMAIMTLVSLYSEVWLADFSIEEAKCKLHNYTNKDNPYIYIYVYKTCAVRHQMPLVLMNAFWMKPTNCSLNQLFLTRHSKPTYREVGLAQTKDFVGTMDFILYTSQ